MVFSNIKKRKRWRENTKRPWLWSYILFFCGDYLWYGLNNWSTYGCFESFDQARLSLYKLIWNWFALVGLVKTSLTRHVFIKPSIVGGMDIEPVVYQLLNKARLHHLWTSEIVLKHLKPYWILNTFWNCPWYFPSPRINWCWKTISSGCIIEFGRCTQCTSSRQCGSWDASF